MKGGGICGKGNKNGRKYETRTARARDDHIGGLGSGGDGGNPSRVALKDTTEIQSLTRHVLIRSLGLQEVGTKERRGRDSRPAVAR